MDNSHPKRSARLRRLLAATVPLLAASAVQADYPATVLQDQPLAYYRLNGSAIPASVNVNRGSLGAAGNATNLNTHPVAGAIKGSRNASAYFDSTARAMIPWNAALNPSASTDFTIEAWFYPTSDKVVGSFVGPAPIMNRYSGSVANRQGWVYFQRNPDESYSGDGQTDVGWNFRTYTGVGSHTGINITSQKPYKLGQWQHVVTVWDAATQTATMYVDGEEAATGGNTSGDPDAYAANTNDHGDEQVNGAAGLCLGSYNNTELGSNPFRGAIDEVAFYAKKLTPAQILAHYQNATNAARSTAYETLVSGDGPVGYWRMDDAVPGADVAVNMGLLQSAGMGTNTAEVRATAGAVTGAGEGARAYHWRNGGATTVLPFTAENNPEATVPFTVEAWFRPTSDRQSPGASPICNRYVASGNRTGWIFFQRAPNDTYSSVSGYEGVGWAFRMYTGSGGGGGDVVSSVPYTVGEWQHVVVTWDGASTATMYVNGVQAAVNESITYTPNTNPAEQGDPSDLAIGSYNVASGLGSNPYEGDVDEVAIYQVQLTPEQIAAHYQIGRDAARTTNYETAVLTAPYDGASTQALQPVTYLRFNELPTAPAVNQGTLGEQADGVQLLVSSVNGPRPPTYASFEDSNLAAGLDGAKSWIGLDNPAGLNLSGQVSLEAWIKPSATQGNPARILSHGPATLSTYTPETVETNGSVLVSSEVFLRLEGDPLAYSIGTSDGTNFHGATFPVPQADLGGEAWVHLVGAYDGTHWRLYRNGTEVANSADTVGALSVPNGGWAIGSTGNGWAESLAGAIDEVAIYNQALTPARVQAHFAQGEPTPLTLSASRVGSQIKLTWPTAAGGTLVRASTVNGPYTDAGLTVTTSEGNNVVLDNIPAGTAAQYYQLRK